MLRFPEELIKEITSNFNTFGVINLVITFITIIFSIIIPIMYHFEKMKITFPKKVYTICDNCNENKITFLIRKKKTDSQAKTFINLNLSILSITTIINIFFYFYVLIELPSFIILSFLNQTYDDRLEYLISYMLINNLFIIAEIAIIIVNILFIVFFRKIKKDTIIAICNNCGKVEEFET